MDRGGPGFGLSFKQRLARGAAGINALLTDDSVREKAGALLQRRLTQGLERGQQAAGAQLAGVRTGLRGVLAKVAEADALRALRRRGDDEPATIDLQVGSRVYEDVPRYMRAQLWLSLLDQQEATARSGAARQTSPGGTSVLPSSPHDTLDDMEALICEGDYYGSLVHGLPASNVGTAAPGEFIEDTGSIIARDISRTFPHHTLFQSAEGRGRLQRVLHAYAIHDPAVGYCQGMAFVAGMLLMHLDEGRAFAALVTLMHGAALRALYLPGMVGLQLRLRQLEELLRRRSPVLAAHLEKHEVSPVIYASAWFLSVFAAEFPFGFTARILDVALAERSSAVVLRVALGLLDAAEEALLALHDFEALIIYIKVELKNLPHERLREILTLSIGMEGVTDATLAALSADIERADAAAPRSSVAGAKARTPRGSVAAAGAAAAAAGEAASADGAAADAADVDDEDDGETDLLGVSSPAAADRGHHRARSNNAVLEMLLDLDLGARLSTSAAAADPDADATSSGDGDADWVSVSAPMGGGTLGVLAGGGALPPPPPHAGEGRPMERPSLRMLATQPAAGAGGAPGAAEPPDLICLHSPRKGGRG